MLMKSQVDLVILDLTKTCTSNFLNDFIHVSQFASQECMTKNHLVVIELAVPEHF